jgi:hypothetical protein
VLKYITGIIGRLSKNKKKAGSKMTLPLYGVEDNPFWEKTCLIGTLEKRLRPSRSSRF